MERAEGAEVKCVSSSRPYDRRLPLEVGRVEALEAGKIVAAREDSARQ
jgi:hypothetical protein